MKKTIISVIITFSILAGFTACESFISMMDDPIISFQSAEIAKIDLNGVELLCKIQVENPNPFAIPFPEVGWELFLSANSLVKGTIRTGNQRLGARGTTVVEVPVSFQYTEAFNAITSLRGRNAVNYKVALSLKFAIPVLGDKVWNMEHEGNIPLPQLPRLASPSISVERIDLAATTILFSVNVNNPNQFELPPPRITFDFMVNRTSVVNNTTSTENGLPANSNTPINMRLTLNQADLARVLGTSLLSSSPVSCNMNASFDFGIPALSSEPSNLQVPGSLRLR